MNMNEMTAHFLGSLPFIMVFSGLMVFIAWRVCNRPAAVVPQTVPLNGVTKIQYRADGAAHVFFKDGTMRTFPGRHLVLRHHNGQLFSLGVSGLCGSAGCELIINADSRGKFGLVVEVPTILLGDAHSHVFQR